MEYLQTAVDRLNVEYGGKNPQVTRVLFTHGSFDAYTKLAAETDINPDAPVEIIDGIFLASKIYSSEG
jgi:hypothetical protein